MAVATHSAAHVSGTAGSLQLQPESPSFNAELLNKKYEICQPLESLQLHVQQHWIQELDIPFTLKLWFTVLSAKARSSFPFSPVSLQKNQELLPWELV